MKTASIPRKETPTKQPPLLPLVLDNEENSEGKTVSHTLRVNPSSNDSNTYKAYVLVLNGTESVRTIIKQPTEISKVITGLNVRNIQDKLRIARTLVEGNALTQLNAGVMKHLEKRYNQRVLDAADDAAAQEIVNHGIDHADNYSNDDFQAYLQEMVTKLVPSKALAKVKRYIRRQCRKPTDMSIRQYYQNLFRINTQEIPALPPFGTDQNFRDDEFIDIILFGTPKGWAQEMERQGFDPMDHSPEEVVSFMEQLEAAESFDKNSSKVAANPSKSGKKKSSEKGNSKKELKYCDVHGECGHSTDECRAKKRAKNGSDKSGGKFSNKTWQRNANKSSDEAKKEIALLVKQALRKEIKAADKKRKSSEDSDGDCFLAEALGSPLDGFNYEQMENLKISNDDEISV